MRGEYRKQSSKKDSHTIPDMKPDKNPIVQRKQADDRILLEFFMRSQ